MEILSPVERVKARKVGVTKLENLLFSYCCFLQRRQLSVGQNYSVMTEGTYRTTNFGGEENAADVQVQVTSGTGNKKNKKQTKNLDDLKKEAEMVSIIS